jgi:prepilin-type N-terminal cleavage/methylation domain-containing protein
MQKMNKNQSGFTLLELLVVVGIMAIIGGAMIATFGGQEQKAARGAATATIAGVENALRIFEAETSNLPNNMESLVCLPLANAADPGAVTTTVNGTPASPADTNSAYKFGGFSNVSGIGGGLGKKVADKFDLFDIPAAGITALTEAGVTSVRYAATAACDNEEEGTTAVTFEGGEIIAASSSLQDISIPGHAFEDPRTGGGASGRNRGRGFSGTLTADSPLMVWKGGTDGYNNLKVGGERGSVLVGLGIGASSDLVGNGDNAAFSKAPYYGQVGKDKYAHYIALFEIGVESTPGAIDAAADAAAAKAVLDTVSYNSEAKTVAVVDARGDFLDEEFAEFTGQKK